MKKNLDFETFLTKKNDLIYQEAFELACAIASQSATSEDVPLEWNMEFIGEIADAAYDILQRKGMRVCYPFYEDEDCPCYLGSDCKTADCPLRNMLREGI